MTTSSEQDGAALIAPEWNRVLCLAAELTAIKEACPIAAEIVRIAVGAIESAEGK